MQTPAGRVMGGVGVRSPRRLRMRRPDRCSGRAGVAVQKRGTAARRGGIGAAGGAPTLRAGLTVAALSGWLGVAAFTGAATAQTASEITPSDFAPEPRRLTGALVFTGEPGLGAPPGAEALTIEIAGVDIEGAFPEMAAANDAAVAWLTDGRIAASVIFETAQALEAAYADAGFVLARISCPRRSCATAGVCG